jgi:hypothetical protein
LLKSKFNQNKKLSKRQQNQNGDLQMKYANENTRAANFFRKNGPTTRHTITNEAGETVGVILTGYSKSGTCYALADILEAQDEHGGSDWARGYGSAGGGGYCKKSTAAGSALAEAARCAGWTEAEAQALASIAGRGLNTLASNGYGESYNKAAQVLAARGLKCTGYENWH